MTTHGAGRTIRLVPVTTDTAAMAADLVHRLLDELSGGRAPDLAELEATAGSLVGRGAVSGAIALDDDTPVGVVMLTECAAIYAGGRFGEITELYVAPTHRSRGLGPRLIEEAVRLARSRGWRRLEVGAPDQAAWRRTLNFYVREGFVEVGPRLKLMIQPVGMSYVAPPS